MQPAISCSKCQLDHLITDPDSGEIVCSICGLVVQEKTQEIRMQYYDEMVDPGPFFENSDTSCRIACCIHLS